MSVSSATKICALAGLELRLYSRYSVAVWWTFILPLIILVISRFRMSELTREYYSSLLIPGLCTYVVLTTSLMGSASYIIGMREFRVFEVLGLLGLKKSDIQLGLLLSRGGVSSIQCVVVMLTGMLLFSIAPHGWHWVRLVLLPIGSLLCVWVVFEISLLVSIYIKTAQAATATATVLLYILIMFGGCFFDIAVLPTYIIGLCYVLPSYHITNIWTWFLGEETHVLDSFLLLVVYAMMLRVINVHFVDTRHRCH